MNGFEIFSVSLYRHNIVYWGGDIPLSFGSLYAFGAPVLVSQYTFFFFSTMTRDKYATKIDTFMAYMNMTSHTMIVRNIPSKDIPSAAIESVYFVRITPHFRLNRF